MMEVRGTEIGVFTIAADHPALPGHFPGEPVVPGVMLLDRAVAAILERHPGQRATGLPSVKFLRPVRPGDLVTVEAAPTGQRIAFACRVDGDEVVRGSLSLAAAT